jgi:hypothetical protein
MIPGLRCVPDYVDAPAHDALLAAVDAGERRDFGERRAQIYGYTYHYTSSWNRAVRWSSPVRRAKSGATRSRAGRSTCGTVESGSGRGACR